MNILYFRQQATKLGYVFILLCLLTANTSSVQVAQAAAGDTVRVSVDSNSVEGNASSGLYGDLTDVAISLSSNGRYVAFLSDASNLVSGDTNGYADIFVRDTVANVTTRVSVNSNNDEGNSWSAWPSISADGRYVAFVSFASNLDGGDANGYADVFVRDRVMNTTKLVSVDSSGAQGYSDARYPSISADGRYVAFLGTFASLNGTLIVMRDTVANTTTPVSVELNGVPDGLSYSPSISADGHYVAFYSQASNEVSGDTNGTYDVFLRDTVANTTMRVSVDANGVEGNGGSLYPSISADGRYVAFTSNATNLVTGITTNGYNIFIRDTLMNTTTLASVASGGVQANGDSLGTSISANGRYLSFVSLASNLVSGDTNGLNDVFVRDTMTNTITRVSVASGGTQGYGSERSQSLSADGRYAAFASDSNSLVVGDNNGLFDVFVHENALTTTTFTISGNTSAGGVLLSYTDGTPKTVTSAANGGYSLTVSSGWSGTVTPSKAGYNFSPPNRA